MSNEYWKPIKQGLPEENKAFLVTILRGRNLTVEICAHRAGYWFYSDNNGEVKGYLYKNQKVLAWDDLPTVYQSNAVLRLRKKKMSENIIDVLDLEFDSNDFSNPITIREYFRKLLSEVWRKAEDFSGKRPFGNSGWQFDVYRALIKNGFIEGDFDEHGFVRSVDVTRADEFIQKQIIQRLFQ